jgi:hypothetical protein
MLTFVVSEPTDSATDSATITNTVTNPLTDKVCRDSGINSCPSSSPKPSRATFMSIVSPSWRSKKRSLMPSSAPSSAVRRLRAPIHGLLTGVSVLYVVADSSQRLLQDVTAKFDFDLEVSLQGIDGDSGKAHRL